MVPIAPHQVFAEQGIEENNSLIGDQENSESLESLNTNIDDPQVYMIDKESKEVTKIDSYNFKEQRYYLTDEIKIKDQTFIQFNDEDGEIGWLKPSSLKKTKINLIDTRTKNENQTDIHKNSESNTEKEKNINQIIEETEKAFGLNSQSLSDETGINEKDIIGESSEDDEIEEKKQGEAKEAPDNVTVDGENEKNLLSI